MLGRSARQAGRRSDIGHVCLSCRQQLLAAAALRFGSRWHTAQSYEHVHSEDWANNFNDLSITSPGTRKSADLTHRKQPSAHPTEVKVRTLRAKPRAVVRTVRTQVQSKPTSAPDGQSSVNGEKSTEWLALARPPRATVEKGGRARRRRRRPGLVATIKETSRERSGENSLTTVEGPHAAAPHDAEPPEMNERLMAQLRTEVASDRVKILEQLGKSQPAQTTPPQTHGEAKLVVNPFAGAALPPFAPSIVKHPAPLQASQRYDDVQVPPGIVSPKRSSDISKPTSSPTKASFGSSSSAHSIVPRMSISEKIKLKMGKPGWTSDLKPPGPVTDGSLGFDKLRKADKVSPVPPPPATAVNGRPYGIDPPTSGGRDFVKVSSSATDTLGIVTKQPSLQSVQSNAESQGSSYADWLQDGLDTLRSEFNAKAIVNGGRTSENDIEGVPDADAPLSRSSEEIQHRTAEVSGSEPAMLAATDDSHHELSSANVNNGEAVPSQGPDGPQQLSTVDTAPNEIMKRRIESKTRRRSRRLTLAEAMKATSSTKKSSGPKSKELNSKRAIMVNNDRATSPGVTTQASVSEVENYLKQLRSNKISSNGEDLSAMQSEVEAPVDMPGGALAVTSIDAKQLNITALDIEQPPVPKLAYGLDRVLFNPGVYQLQDPLSRVFNFDPYLQKIMPVVEFDFNALKEYRTSSQDTTLNEIARKQGKKYVGSTSSMTGTLGHFHYLLSAFRPLNLNMLSRGFPDKSDGFTNINKAPNAIFLRRKENGLYAIDADKELDSGNVLMLLGKSMEKLLTMPKDEYERYRKSDSRTISEAEKNVDEAHQYTTMGDFLMRSQLDAFDPRLPGTGMFDLKTRAVVSVRMDSENFQPMTGYEIQTLQGRFESYEREYYDMMRSTMLKYSLQARMGRMDGIFVAYHNVERIFGFQYLPMQDMDRVLHGQVDPCLGDQEFKLSINLLNEVLEKATEKFPDTSLRIHFETKPKTTSEPFVAMYIFAEPMEEAEIDRIQSSQKEKIAKFEKSMMGIEQQDAGLDAAAHESSENADERDGACVSESDPAIPVADLTSSASGADTAFFATIKDIEVPKKPLFAATMMCMSKVNGETASPRPERLKAEDEWTVQYLLKEMTDPTIAWAQYERTKSRRREAFLQASKEATINAEGETMDNSYIKFLKQLSQRGRDFRGKMDQIEAEKDAVVFEPMEKTAAS